MCIFINLQAESDALERTQLVCPPQAQVLDTAKGKEKAKHLFLKAGFQK